MSREVGPRLMVTPDEPGLPTTFNDERWWLRFVGQLPAGNDDNEGLCVYDKKEILVLAALEGFTRLEALIHEMLHAGFPQASEDWVTKTAHEMALVVHRDGYRRRT